MGVGDPLLALYRLNGPLPPGGWHFIGDGLIYEAVDMRFDVLWRAGNSDTPIVTFAHHFDPPPDGPGRYDAVGFEADAMGAAVPAADGDFLVLRFAVESVHPAGTKQYVPNADGVNHDGRIPSLRLPR